MRRVRKRNAEPILKKEYIVCKSRRNMPQLNHVICEVKCKKYMNCHEYSEWYFQYYGKELEKPKKKTGRKGRKKK